MVKRILAAIAAIVLLLAMCTLAINAEETQTQSAVGTTKWDNVELYMQDYIASQMGSPQHFNIAQWVALADRTSFNQYTQSMYVNMVWNTENEGTTTAQSHFLDRRYYDLAATGKELVADVYYFAYLVFEDELTQPRGREFYGLRISANNSTVNVTLTSSSNAEVTQSALLSFVYDVINVGEDMVEISLRQIRAKWTSSESFTNYTPEQIKGWIIYSLWDMEGFVNINSPFERIMIAIMNYTPEDYQYYGDWLNGDLYYYGVIDYEAITVTWKEMQKYAVDMATYMYTEGYNLGNAQGHDRGYENGYEYGYTDGYDWGDRQGYARGDADGYDRGLVDGSGYGEEVLNIKYEEGYNNGYGVGDTEGYNRGYQEGKIDGESVGLQTGSSFAGFFVSLFSAPMTLLESTLDFDFLGINMLAFVKTLLTLSVVGVIVFIVFKFMK